MHRLLKEDNLFLKKQIAANYYYLFLFQLAEYFTNLKSALDEHGANLSSVLLTHWHGDHVGGVDTVVTDIAQVRETGFILRSAFCRNF